MIIKLSISFALLILALVYFRSHLKTLISYISPFRSIHYVGFAAGGYLMALRMVGETIKLNYFIPILLYPFFAFQSAAYLNNHYDRKTDEYSGKHTPLTDRIIKEKENWLLHFLLLAVSLFLASAVGVWPLIFTIAGHLISYTYSVYPVRLKRFFPLNIFFISLGALFSMVSGFSSLLHFKLFPLEMAVLILVTFTLSFNTKDLWDVKGDKIENIKTLFTLLPMDKAKRINSLMVLFSYLVTPLILRYPLLYLAAIPGGVFSYLELNRSNPRENIIFLIYIAFGLLILFLILTKTLPFMKIG